MARASRRAGGGGGEGRSSRRVRGRQSSSSMPIILGVVVVAGLGGGLFVMQGSGSSQTQNKAPDAPAAPPKPFNPTGADIFQPKMPDDPNGQAQFILQQAKHQARQGKDPDGALQKVSAALGKWNGEYDAELYYTMAVIWDEKGGTQQVWAEKLKYYLKCEEALKNGSKFAYDPLGNRKQNLQTAIKIAREKSGM